MMHAAKAMQIAINGLRRKTIISSVLKNIARNSSVTTWNKDWKPGPYPRTQEQRIAAAKKYNMIPEDYEPYPEEEGYGDYPMFKNYHAETRNPFEPFDNSVLKRNYGEPVHPDFDITLEDKINFDYKQRTPLWKQMMYVSIGVTLYAWMVIYYENNLPCNHRIQKQYPVSGVPHYSFEPEN